MVRYYSEEQREISFLLSAEILQLGHFILAHHTKIILLEWLKMEEIFIKDQVRLYLSNTNYYYLFMIRIGEMRSTLL